MRILSKIPEPSLYQKLKAARDAVAKGEKHVKLANNMMDVSKCTKLFDILMNGEACKLETLDLSNNQFDAMSGKSFAKLIAKNRSIRSLDLSHNFLLDEGIKEIAQGLGKNGTLLSLDLSHNQISDNSSVASLIGAAKQLKHLRLAANNIGGFTGDIWSIMDALGTNQSLESLDLSQNEFSFLFDDEMEGFGEDLIHDHDEDLEKMRVELCAHRSLKHFDFSGNALVENGNCFADVINDGKLESLNLAGCGIFDVTPIAQALGKSGSTLKKLNLSWNPIQSGLSELVSTLREKNQTLQELDIHSVTMPDEVAVQFVQLIDVDKSGLTSLDLRNNALGNHFGEKLHALLKDNESTKLHSLGISGNAFAGQTSIDLYALPLRNIFK